MFQPFKLGPACKDYLWGGSRLAKEYGKKCKNGILAESWEISTHPDGASVITSGEYSGTLLSSFLQDNPACLGKAEGGQLPFLVKFIDAYQDLSLQVHPDNEYSMKHENQPGKTEMWYVLDALPGAVLACGFKDGCSRHEVQRHIGQGTLADLCAWHPVKKGDVFLIEAGTIHAIGAGVLLIEVQQNSNVTYRIDDYGRRASDGKPRPLHIEKALDVLHYEAGQTPLQRQYTFRSSPGVTIEPLLGCRHFSTQLVSVNGRQYIQPKAEDFHTYTCLAGQGILLAGSDILPIAKGDSFFVPAASGAYSLVGDLVLFDAYV